MSKIPPEVNKIRTAVIIAVLGGIIAYQSWTSGEAPGDSLCFKLGILFSLGGTIAAIQGIRRVMADRTPALPAAPAEYTGAYAPDFRRNLEKLHAGLGGSNQEMILEKDYAFWYNKEQTIELTLTGEGWLAFFQLPGGENNLEAPLVLRAVADSPFATHPVAQELAQKYCDLPVSGIAWCTGEKMLVYPYTSTGDFTLMYANNLFAPAAAFDQWLDFYLATGMMNHEE